MSTVRNRLRHRETIVPQRGHEGEFFQGREPAHVHPGAGVAVAQVVAVGFDGAEGNAPQAVDLEYVLNAAGGGDDEDVAFFADADLVADGIEDFAFEVSVEGEVVETAVCEAVSIVWVFVSFVYDRSGGLEAGRGERRYILRA